MVTRRGFLGALATGVATAALTGPRSWAQGATSGTDTGAQQDVPGVRTTMSGPMNDNAYRSVQLPPKPGAGPSMTPAARDVLEHQLHCQCGCTLDVYTCRTTDFTCPISPAMHQDVMLLVAGGYTGPEILHAFQAAYGERVLMAPVRRGFNLAGYFAPFVAVGAGGAAVAVLIRRWQAAAQQRARSTPAPAAPAASAAAATPEELAELDAAIRDDTR